ncbi:MAG: hypothetical protein RB148_12435 [Armatimonadota bacterium]|nr:hypothetical protein [Armatimonadota bacterium]
MEPTEEKVVGFLVDQWREGLRITTVPQALAALGIPDDEEMRVRIGRRLEQIWRRRLGPFGLWRGLRWLRRPSGWRRAKAMLPAIRRLPSLVAEVRAWNPAVYILSNGEKLIARHILLAGKVPSPEEIGTALGLSGKAVETGLRLLRRLGFLVGEQGSYRLAPAHARLLEGLGFNSHTVTLEGGEQFNVP